MLGPQNTVYIFINWFSLVKCQKMVMFKLQCCNLVHKLSTYFYLLLLIDLINYKWVLIIIITRIKNSNKN